MTLWKQSSTIKHVEGIKWIYKTYAWKTDLDGALSIQ